jgi:hypothetical protein
MSQSKLELPEAHGEVTLTAKLRFADFSRLVQPRLASLSVPIG